MSISLFGLFHRIEGRQQLLIVVQQIYALIPENEEAIGCA